MVALTTREDYTLQLQGLLPQGDAWPRTRGTVLWRLLEALAGPFLALDDAAVGVLGESVPSGAFHLLPEWEAMWGLPDSCSDASQTIAGRRAAIVGRMVSGEGISSADIVAFAARWDVQVRVREPDAESDVTSDSAAAAELAKRGIVLANDEWRFIWWLDVGTLSQVREFDTLSDVNVPLYNASIGNGNELICRLRALVPSHTLAIFGFYTPS